MHANNPMCHVSMYNQILSSAAGPCGKCAKLSAMRSLKTLNNDALFSNAGHGDADGITQPNKEARCTGTEDFFQSSSNFKSEDAKTLAEARALTLLRPARERKSTKHKSVSFHGSQLVKRGHTQVPIKTISSERIAPVLPSIDRPTDRSFVQRAFDRVTDATAERDASKSFAPIRARIDTAASSRAVDVERIASHRIIGNGSRYARVGTVLERNRMDLTIRDSSNGTPQDPGVARRPKSIPSHSIHRTVRRDATVMRR